MASKNLRMPPRKMINLRRRKSSLLYSMNLKHLSGCFFYGFSMAIPGLRFIDPRPPHGICRLIFIPKPQGFSLHDEIIPFHNKKLSGTAVWRNFGFTDYNPSIAPVVIVTISVHDKAQDTHTGTRIPALLQWFGT